jgi:hypothetical protein
LHVGAYHPLLGPVSAVLEVIVKSLDGDSHLLGLIGLDFDQLFHGLVYQEVLFIFPKLSGSQLRKVENVVDQEVEDAFTGHLNCHGLNVLF